MIISGPVAPSNPRGITGVMGSRQGNRQRYKTPGYQHRFYPSGIPQTPPVETEFGPFDSSFVSSNGWAVAPPDTNRFNDHSYTSQDKSDANTIHDGNYVTKAYDDIGHSGEWPGHEFTFTSAIARTALDSFWIYATLYNPDDRGAELYCWNWLTSKWEQKDSGSIFGAGPYYDYVWECTTPASPNMSVSNEIRWAIQIGGPFDCHCDYTHITLVPE